MKEWPDNDHAIEAWLKDAMDKEIPREVEERLRDRLDDFKVRLVERDSRKPRAVRFARVAYRLSWAAVFMGVVFGGAWYLFVSSADPTWAQVMRRFATVSYLQATIYVREDALAMPVELELWSGYGGKLRLHVGNKVAFGDKGRFIEDVPVSPDRPAPPGMKMAEATVQHLVEKVGSADTFSFETLLRLLPDLGDLSAPLLIQDETVSNDLILFDLTSRTSPEWVRIWTLRESRLPVRVLYWDPRSGQTTDVLLSYGNQQSVEFFDPAAFKARLAECKTPSDRAYALLGDVAGRPVTPADAAALKKAREGTDLGTSPEGRAHAAQGI